MITEKQEIELRYDIQLLSKKRKNLLKLNLNRNSVIKFLCKLYSFTVIYIRRNKDFIFDPITEDSISISLGDFKSEKVKNELFIAREKIIDFTTAELERVRKEAELCLQKP